MSTFDLAWPIVKRHEGGFVNNPNDPGGATNFGVSLRWLVSQGLLTQLEHDEGDVTQDAVTAVKLMTEAEAQAFYVKYWWDANGYANVVSQALATKLVDTAINMGSVRANNFAQEIVGITPTTGHFGPKTTAAVNAFPQTQFILAYQNKMADFYRSLVAANPKRAEFLAGWLNRAYDRI